MKSLLNNKINFILSQLILIHLIGVIGLNSSKTRELFEHISSLNLLLAALIIFYFEKHKNTSLYIYIFIVFIIGMSAEIIGVHTQKLFGEYYYTNTLGFSILKVPLIIGINWVVLTYCTAKITNQFLNKHTFLNIVIGAILMVLLDVLLEFFAVKHQLWIWKDRTYPSIQNFAGWFFVSLLTHSTFRFLVKKTENKIAIYYFIILVFFLLIDNIISFR